MCFKVLLFGCQPEFEQFQVLRKLSKEEFRVAGWKGEICVHGVIASVEVRRERVAASVRLRRTNLMSLHGLIVPNLAALVNEAEGGRRDMGDDVCVMYHSAGCDH